MNTALTFSQPPSFLKLLAHDIRWKILVLLGRFRLSCTGNRATT